MQEYKLAAKTRTKMSKAVKTLLSAGVIPAVIYGRGVESRSIEVEAIPFRKIYGTAGESSLVDLSIDGTEPVKVLIHETQSDPLKNTFSHIDFIQVNMKEKLTTEIPFEFVGESLAVKGLGGTLIKNRDNVEVECLPSDLVHEITVDIGKLATFEDVIRVRDLVFPKGIEVLSDPADVVAMVTPPRSDEEMSALETKVETKVEDVKVVEKKKAEDEEAAATETPAPKK